MRILITGGRGMVGRNIAEHVRSQTHAVFRPSRNELDLLDIALVRKFLLENAIGFIVHAAGRVGGIRDNIDHPVDFLTANLKIGCNVVEAARSSGVTKLINLASSCVYPRDHDDKLREEMILTGELEPTNEAYALAKIAIMRLCEYTSRQFPDCRFKTVIPCNLYGRYDKFDATRAHLVPAALAKIHKAKVDGEAIVELWGDGKARREFMYAEDFADFIWEAVDRFDDLPDVMNVGLGGDLEVNDFYHEAAAVVGWAGRFQHDLTKPAGMRRKLVDISRQTAFGWSPKFTLQEGMLKTYHHYIAGLASNGANDSQLEATII